MKKSSGRIRDTVFFGGYFLYAWKAIKPDLYCSFNEPVFSSDSRYLSGFFHYPGGLLRLFSDFLSQFYVIPWIGALVLTGIAAGLTFATRGISESLSKGRSARPAHLFPAVLLLVLHNHYFHQLTADIGILLTSAAFYLHLRMAAKSRLMRTAWALSGTAFIYYAAGGFLLVFASLCCLHEFMIGRRWIAGVFYAGAALLLPALGAGVFFTAGWRDAYLFQLPLDAGYKTALAPYGLLLYSHAMILAAAAPGLFRDPIRMINPGLRMVSGGALSVFCVLLVLMTRDRKIQTMLQIDSFIQNARYEDVIRLAGRKESDHLLVTMHTNRALYHTGRLLDDMFSFPQKWRVSGLILSSKEAYEMPLANSDVWFDLGHVNEAQHWAHEALAVTGNAPRICRRLAEIYIVRDNPAAAEKCLAYLERTLFFRAWAKQARKLLAEEPPGSGDGRLAEIRSRMVAEDFIVHPDFPERDLEFIVRQNPANKMAFEYLIAHYLLMGLPDRLADRVDHLKTLHYARIPRHFQEALILRQVLLKMKPVPPEGFSFSRETVLRFRDFQKSLKRYQDGGKTDRSELKKSFGDTYWYYYLFENPMRRPRQKPGMD
jgi:hypothetical protein